MLPTKRAGFQTLTDTCARWNRKLHYYAGLYLLFFICLFAFTGLLLNHPQWSFAQFWDSRRQTSYEREITAPGSGGDLGQARDLMRQLAITGEIEWTTTRADVNRFSFRVARPDHFWDVKADFDRQRATVQRTDLNSWGLIRSLHTFTGVRENDPRNSRDWFLTSVWAWTMDGVAVGLIFLVLSSFYMWYQLPQKRRQGMILLSLGALICTLFCFGLRWLF